VRLLEEANVPMTRAGWIMTPRSKWHLMTLLDSTGNKVFWDEMMLGTLFTFPYRTTTQIPNNLGAAGNQSEIYLAEFPSLIIGENTQLLIDVFPGGAYHDGSSVVSGISSDQTVIRTIARHDFGARYRGKEIAVITAVDWAA
jgi:HK97 family phage major capsid protein